MDFKQKLARIGADQDQDIENAKDWIRGSEPDEVLHLWAMLNKTYPNPYTEVMTRFAIIGFTAVVQAINEAENTPHE